jgi:hypothetical protein
MVDVGIGITDKDIFEDNHYWDSFFFPKNSTTTTEINHHIASYSSFVPPLVDPITESFAELIRRYFVAFSRAQYLLIVIGTDAAFHGLESRTQGKISKIKNTALGDGINLINQEQQDPALITRFQQFLNKMVRY